MHETNISFKSARINILSMADNHGKLKDFPFVYETILKNRKQIFHKSYSENTLNIFDEVGDAFINTSQKKFLSNPLKSAGDIQMTFFIKMISEIKKICGKNFQAVYTPGNHGFDGGSTWLINSLNKNSSKFDTILTNATFKNKNKFFNKKIYQVVDSKDKNKTHKMLMLGLTPQNLKFFVPTLKNVKLLDENKKMYKNLTEDDLNETIQKLSSIIKKFKNQNPQGAVVINAHTGENISNIIAKKINGIDIILNAHDHKSGSHIINGTQILSHGQNNEFFRGTNLFFDDNGKLSLKGINVFYTDTTQKISAKNPIIKTFNKILSKDMEPRLKTNQNLGIEGVRYSQNLLANYVSDNLYETLIKTHPNLNACGFSSSSFRGGLQNGSSNLEILHVLDGTTQKDAQMYFAKLTGSQLKKLLSSNVKENLQDPNRNCILQWSNIKINKTAFKNDDVKNAFQIRINNKYQSINGSANYEIALPHKYVEKYCPEELKEKFIPSEECFTEIFINSLKKSNFELNLNAKNLETRIIQ